MCLILAVGFSACGNGNRNNGKIKIVTTIFPIYDWTREIAGNSDSVEIEMLIDNGVDLHSFQFTPKDKIDIITSDMFVYVGGESDKWVNDVMADKQNENMVVINLMDALGSGKKTEELKEGMQEEGEEEEEDEEGPEYDEHVWLSLKNAVILCNAICEGLCKADPNNADTYKANNEAYKEKLKALDADYKAAVDSAEKKTLVFADRFPFRYLADDYSIDYYAAFSGCSAESEASVETFTFLAGKIDELGLNSVMKIEGPNMSIAEQVKSIASNKDLTVLTLNSMQSVTAADIGAGATYLKLCSENLEVLKEALK